MRKTHSAGGVVINQTGKVLVVNQNGRSWSLPKGHIDPGEDARTAAAREIEEESGVAQLRYVKDLGSYQRYQIGLDGQENPEELKTITMFLYTTEQETLQPQDPDNPEARWVEPEKVTSLLTHPKDQQFFEGIRAEIDKLDSPAQSTNT